MTHVGRRRFVQGAIGATAWLAAPGRLIAWPAGAVTSGGLPDRYPPIVPGFPHLLHGGDWNPDQWRDEPGVLEQDFGLMEKAGCNTFSVGIFAWAALEPAEGRFELGWLDEVLDGLAKRGFHAFLATPSGAKPRWMSEKYEEVRRIDAQGRRELHGSRHNHCFTSPVYREKVRLAIPRRVYTQSHIDYVAEAVIGVASMKQQLRGYRMTKAPAVLRHFTALFEPLPA